MARIVWLGCLLLLGCRRDGHPQATETPPPSWQPDRSCTSHQDCVPAASCCVQPCTSDVINKKDAEKQRAQMEASCTAEARAHCPVAGSCPSHRYVCENAKCTIRYESNASTRPDGCPRDLLAARGMLCSEPGKTCSEPGAATRMLSCSGGKWTELAVSPPPPPPKP